MKRLFCLVIGLCVSVVEANPQQVRLCERTYVAPEQICIQENRLLIDFGEFCVQPKSLHADAQGLYFDAIYEKQACPAMAMPSARVLALE